MKWLTIEQTLGDIAEFVSYLRIKHFGFYRGNVILWGSGFGASLAAWARMINPNSIDSVWASSGLFSHRVKAPCNSNNISNR